MAETQGNETGKGGQTPSTSISLTEVALVGDESGMSAWEDRAGVEVAGQTSRCGRI